MSALGHTRLFSVRWNDRACRALPRLRDTQGAVVHHNPNASLSFQIEPIVSGTQATAHGTQSTLSSVPGGKFASDGNLHCSPSRSTVACAGIGAHRVYSPAGNSKCAEEFWRRITSLHLNIEV